MSEARTAIWFQESVPLIPSTLFFLPTLSHCQEICYKKKQWPTHLDSLVPHRAIAERIKVAWPSSAHSLWTALPKLRCQSISVYMLHGHSGSHETFSYWCEGRYSSGVTKIFHFKMMAIGPQMRTQNFSFLTIPMYHFWSKYHKDKLRIFAINLDFKININLFCLWT